VYGRGYGSSGFGFGPAFTPPLIINLIIANAVVFFADLLLGGALNRVGSVSPREVWLGGFLWQPFTYMWLHSPTGLSHVGFNMLALWMFGSPLAAAWGEKRFLRFYLLCGVGAGLLIVLVPALGVLLGLGTPASYVLPTLGASGAIFGVLLAYSLTWPDRTIMLLFPPIPIKAIYFIPFLFFMEFFFGPRNVSHLGHLGGVLVGWVLFRSERRLPFFPSPRLLQHRWRRWRMRRQLHEVRREQQRAWRDQDRRLH
jgi:membrane associated rhomboid family serine protease